jgi:hypothetical protein
MGIPTRDSRRAWRPRAKTPVGEANNQSKTSTKTGCPQGALNKGRQNPYREAKRPKNKGPMSNISEGARRRDSIILQMWGGEKDMGTQNILNLLKYMDLDSIYNNNPEEI